MMTPTLEHLVLSSQATVKTHNHGVGGVGCIIVPPGKQIVITQIIWHPFIDVRNTELLQNNTFLQSGSFLHTLKLRNHGKQHAFTFRDTFRTALSSVDQREFKLQTIFYPEKPIVVDTYLPFVQGNVDIDVFKFTDFHQWNVIANKLPPTTVEPEPAIGYGNGSSANKFDTVLLVDYYNGAYPPYGPYQYIPPTNARTGNTNPNATNEFEGTVPLTYPNAQFFGGPNDTDVSMFPMITFTYVEMNARYIPGNTISAPGISATKK